MKTTNKYKLPSVFERFDKAHPYTKGASDFSVTTLIDSPQIHRLREQYHEERSEDISERIWSIFWTAIHAILESGAEPDQIVEERFFTTVETPLGTKVVSGQVDLQTPTPHGYILSDYKTTGAFSIQANPEGKPEHVRQLNLYAALARRNEVAVSGLEVIAIIRDWTSSNAARNEDYPRSPITRIPIEMWGEDEAEEYLVGRVEKHLLTDVQGCTLDEMWAKPPVFAVHELTKSGTVKKRATKLFDSMTEAESMSLGLPGSEVIERPRKFARCEGDYCGVSRWCKQYQNIKES